MSGSCTRQASPMNFTLSLNKAGYTICGAPDTLQSAVSHAIKALECMAYIRA